MKKSKRILVALMILPLFATTLVFSVLPEQIPAHYGIDGIVNRWGSKYELLILPVICILFGIVMSFVAKVATKEEHNGNQNNATIVRYATMGTLSLFNLMNFYILYTAYAKVENLNTLSFDLSQLTFLATGLCLIVIGNILPKARQNQFVGLRTSWSMKNRTTWKKSQLVGGVMMIFTGLGMILISFTLRGFLCLLVNLCLLVVAVLLSTLATYLIYRKYGTN